LHDGPIQRLSALALNLEQVKRSVGSGQIDDGLLARTQQSLSLEIRRLRLMMGELRPPALDEHGLSSALRDHAINICRGSGLEFREDFATVTRVPDEVETALFRVAQEALTNIVRHARASTVSLSLNTSPGAVVLIVEDDGVGFDPESNGTGSGFDHFGLVGMRERVELAGGSWSVTSAPGRGTKIVAAIPVVEEEVA
jgi:signal transduction histidine kinase